MTEFLEALRGPEGKERILAIVPFLLGGGLAVSLVAAVWLRRPLLRFFLAAAGAGSLLAVGIWRDEFGEVMFNAAML